MDAASDDIWPAPDLKAPDRRCIATGKVRPKTELVRFVIGPDDLVVPDVAAKLPGRGLWVSACEDALALAIKKNGFARAARRSVRIPDDLAGQTAALLEARGLAHIGFLRRAGDLVCGFEKVREALKSGRVPACMLVASDAASDGKGKLQALAGHVAAGVPVIDLFTKAQLGDALGREHVVHGLAWPGRLAGELVVDAARLAGIRGRDTGCIGPHDG